MAYREGNIEAGGVSMDGILDGKPGMTIDELIALLEKGPIKAEKNKKNKKKKKKKKNQPPVEILVVFLYPILRK